MNASTTPLKIREIMGWTSEAPAQAWLTLRGDPSVPASKFGPSSLRVYTPRLAMATWAGRRPYGRKVPIVNLFNRTPTPIAEGWSVKVTQVRDFRGGRMTYDSHNGTDFALVAGTKVVAPAPARVVAIRNEYNRGGLKLYLDHGGGLLTSHHHLGRTLCQVGDIVGRGDVVALSAYSGLDAMVSFPFVAPHIHMNTAIGGQLIDPFAEVGTAEVPLWRGDAGLPEPHGGADDRTVQPTRFDAARVDAAAAALHDSARREVLMAAPELALRAWNLAIEAMVYPTRFADPQAVAALFEEAAPRAQRLDLPVDPALADGIVFGDDDRFLGA